MTEDALAYARAGLHVLPIKPGDKAPLSRLVPNGHLDATTDEETIRRWWGSAPDAGIGINLEASGLVAVDIDPRNGGSVDHLPWRPMKTPLQRTGGGGWHLLYKAEDGIRLPKELAPGIDLKHRGYIVVAPSIHPVTGKQYVWKYSPLEVAPRPMPAKLKELAKRQIVETRKRIASGAKVVSGSRNDFLAAMAGSLRRQGAELEVIRAALLVANAEQLEEPLPDEEVEKVAASIARYAPNPDIYYPRPALPISPPGEGVPAVSGQTSVDTQQAPPALDPRYFYLDDTGNAVRLVVDHGDDYRYIPEYRDWYCWTGVRWERDTGNTLMERATECAEALEQRGKAEPDDDHRKAVIKWAKTSRSLVRLKAAMERSQPALSRPASAFDNDPWSLNLPNGILTLQPTGHRLDKHERKRLHSLMAGVPYDQHARCPRWDDFIARVLPDDELADYVKRCLGYCLLPDTGEQVMFILHGTGANGKSVLTDTIRTLMGDYAKIVRSDALLMDQRNGIPSDIARLRGARFVVSQETELGSRLAEGLVKTITGDRRLMARFMYGEWFEFDVEFKLWLSTNHKPVIRGTDHGIWRRLKLIPFTEFIPADERVPELDRKLVQEEGSGILNWLIEGLYDYYDRGSLDEPAVIQAEVQRYQDEMDPITSYMREYVTQEEDALLQARVLYKHFREWMQDNGYSHPPTNTSFGMTLSERGYEKVQRNGRTYYKNITFKHDVLAI